MRLDVYLYEYGYAESRTRARFLIGEGAVVFDGDRSPKASLDVDEKAEHEVVINSGVCPYVSVGGMKLDSALERFGIDICGHVCADIGASTGGFTDCLLAHGAKTVYAIDSGTSQLHEKLRDDPRVISMEGCNARYIGADTLPERVTTAVCDVSFISQTLILPAVAEILMQDGNFISLVKPQFELDKKRVGRGGIVSEPSDRAEAIYKVVNAAAERGLELFGITLSPVSGGGINDAKKKGNLEFLAYFRYTGERVPSVTQADVREYVKNCTFSPNWNKR